MSYKVVARWIDDKDERIRFLEKQADVLETERDIARQNHLDSCRLARERLDRIHELEAKIDRLQRWPT